MRARHAAIAMLLAAPAFGLSGEAGAQPHALRHDDALDLTAAAGGGVAWIATAFLLPGLAPDPCRWCKSDDLDDGVREALVWRRSATANTLSDVAAFGLMPFAVTGLDALAALHDRAGGSAGLDALILLESTVLATDVNQLTKLLVGRQRPFAHARAADPNADPHPRSDDNLSFFSGHTTEVFALAASAGTVASLRGYRWAPLIWGTGMTVAAVTAYLRIAADEHWLTDVLVGMVVGAGMGVGLPLAFHGRETATSGATAGAAAPNVSGASFSLPW